MASSSARAALARRRGRHGAAAVAVAIESLELRRLLSADLLVQHDGVVSEYTPAGTFVRSVTVQAPGGGAAAAGTVRDIAAGPGGLLQVYNGAATPSLSTYDPSAPAGSQWSHHAATGWNTLDVAGYGGIAVSGTSVFVSDMLVSGDTYSGVVRFDAASNYTSSRSGVTYLYRDLAAGPSGKVYAYDGSYIDVLNGSTLALENSFPVGQYNLAAFGVAADGRIIAADATGTLYRFSASGAYEAQATSGLSGIMDVDVDADGTVLLGTTAGGVATTTTALGTPSVLTAVATAGDHYVAFGTLDGTQITTGSVTGVVANDLNGDGVRVTGEPALSGRTVFVDLNGDGVFTAAKDKYALSDSSGNFTITGVAPGTYWVMQVVPSGWKASAPVNGLVSVTVTAGNTATAGLFLTRAYSPSPYLDSTFGTGGLVQFGAGDGVRDQMIGLARASDGKLLAAGYAGGFNLFRFNADGTPDTTFGAANGRVKPSVPSGVSTSFEMALQPDGKILVGAVQGVGSVPALIRYNSNGTLDTSFGTNGAFVLTGYAGQIHDIAVDSLGRIVVAGHASNVDFSVARLTAGGQYDTTFDGDGKATFDIGGYDSAWGVAVQPDNKILVGGEGFFDGGGYYGYVLRLNENGGRDANFGANGAVLTKAADYGYSTIRWEDLALMDDGRIVVGGSINGNMAVARYTSGGVLDATFAGGKGFAFTAFPRGTGVGNNAFATADFVAVLPDGSIYAAGDADTTARYSEDIAAARFLANGTLDTGFGSGGRATAALSTSSERIYAAIADPTNNKLLVAGFSGGGSDAAIIARFTAPAPARVAGFIYNDTNGNGVLDTGENALLSGRTAYIDANNNGSLDAGERTFVTQVDGYWFDNLSAGTYTIRTVLPPGWVQTAPANNGARVVTVASGQLVYGLDFGTRADPTATAAISGTVYVDANGNGRRDNEGGTSGRTVYLDANNNGKFDAGEATSVTAGDGSYSFSGLASGTYRVRMALPGGSAQTSPAEDAALVVNLTAGTPVTGQDFGWKSAAAGYVSGVLFDDTDADGTWDAGELPMEGAVVYADANNDGVFQYGEESGGTQANGTYALPLPAGFAGGALTVRMIVLSGYRASLPTPQSNTQPPTATYVVNYGAGDTAARWRPFGITRDRIWVTGTVYEDTNLNGARDAGEPAVNDAIVYDDANDNSHYDQGEVWDFSGFSDHSGGYTLRGVPYGSRKIRVEPNSARSVVAPTTRTVTGTTGYTLFSNEDFGMTPLAPAQAPFLGSPFAITTTGITTIQTEDFDTGGEGVAYHDLEATNRGGKYRTTEGVDIESTTDSGGGYNVGYTRAGEWMEYTINVSTAGMYDLGFRVAAAAAGAQFHAEVDGTDVTGALAVPNTGGSQNWTTVTRTGVNLPAGQHVLRLAMDVAATNGALGNFNWIRVSPPPPPPPPQTPFKGTPFAVPASGTVTIQSEDFDNGGEGIAYHDADATNNGGKYRTTEGVDIESTTDTGGGGYNVGWTRPGEWLEYTIHVDKAQPYNLAFRVASAASGAKFHAEIDGVDVTGAMSVPNTGGYQKWQTVLARDVSIAAGDHVLRVKMDVASTSGSVGNFDYVQISEAVVPPPTKIVQTTTTAYVQDGTSANTNFGSSTQLIVKKYAGTGYTRESFLKFDLSTLTTITSAKLRLFGRLNDTSQPSLDVGVAYTDSQSWTEGGITWNNRPTATTGLTTVTVSGTTAQWYEIDVTDFLKAQKALGHNTVTIVLKNATASTAYATFNSDDAATNRPELLVET